MRETLRGSAILFAVFVGVTAGLSAQTGNSVFLPNEAGEWSIPQAHVGRTVTRDILVEMVGHGVFSVDPVGIETVRPEIIQANHFTVFDLLVKLDREDRIDLESHDDDAMGTHVIDSLHGESGWWYQACYSAGWFERNTHRMDHFPVKSEGVVRFSIERAAWLSKLYRAFEQAMARIAENDGRVIVPRVRIEGPRRERIEFENVAARAHDTRIDVLQPGTVTALDILLSPGEQSLLKGWSVT